jgi:hypothetical protein
MLGLVRLLHTTTRVEFELVLAVLVWCLLEWARWVHTLWGDTQAHSDVNLLSEPITYVGLLVTALPALTVFWFLRRQVRDAG